ncbi:hypothetical protein A3H80_02270 [Candidatus Roizmanbacteria bacterium RIFCSPLOWO2_02_FULL_37_19]|uniref:Uncharacterized protein n=1 Tax=Candidatus Roizmanbacteria bacterium RIFCSPHIGHO2_02_FULL_37_24 TaxID=1802037 RepID=A0A1F7H1J8_9BACT|nr:MAG: hypothetical protein A2862_02890 [Candidatus Roizmanbacteria bacterium RIFCSPHIGHO2_01_FULL_38_41]OGK24736.1 MAG: hypothetical protein A3C24_01270 [Candidatus Roizmanbacteria bacterium RIFCSPHIGHO2_02_FULL_37_24]OGK32912.1 MAG: hypothetical protein A3E10_03015 [Candidatus Roizmanbacteria bacterium RIFCSPHIGHO2_12_FULL_37_23]OGK44127.1 MAG: hypothetical protein A2956_03695 [Candidatus Roizmanbacteria bacterium RIFCSPLOWO2_01_FULL_37_57]OGK54366.1 MAG: hypothetical protein A3H80_02270 [Ca
MDEDITPKADFHRYRPTLRHIITGALFMILTIIVSFNLGKTSIKQNNVTISPTIAQTTTLTPTITLVQQNIELGPCQREYQLDVGVGAPFKPEDINIALKYFQKNGLKIIEPENKNYEANNVYFVVEIPPQSTGRFWLNKMQNDGFTHVDYHIVIGCDEISS